MRQGDPMSPYLFVICIEYFFRILSGLGNDAAFRFHPKCKNFRLIHLVFADDMMLFSKANKISPILLKNAFDEFAVVSGLNINLQKSRIFFGTISSNVKQFLLMKLGSMRESCQLDI